MLDSIHITPSLRHPTRSILAYVSAPFPLDTLSPRALAGDDRPCAEAVGRSTIRIHIVRYEWDEAKNRQNQRLHGGISFELAALVFEDEHCLVGPDRVDERGEQRWHALGKVRLAPEGAAILLVVHAYREDAYGEEVIRIISARRAEKHEIRRYQEQAMD